MNKIVWVLVLLFLSGISHFSCCAQSVYGSYYHDLDSGADNGLAVRRLPDSTLFLFGGGNYLSGGPTRLGGIILSARGDSLLSYHLQNHYPVRYLQGEYGTLLPQSDGGFITHQTIQRPTIPAKTGRTWDASIVRLRPNGDTAWVRTYTDTNLFSQAPFGVSQSLSDSSLVIGGWHFAVTSGTQGYGFLMFVDSGGVKRRELTYQHPQYRSTADGSVSNVICRPAFLADGKRVLVTESARTYHTSTGGDYYKRHPWVFICDTQGTILKQRALAQRYSGGGVVPFSNLDQNGGYYLVGSLDTILDPLNQPTVFVNYPSFLMKLDTSLNTEWIWSAGDSNHAFRPYTVKQLRNNSYLLIGWTNLPDSPGDAGWLAVVNANGTLKWSRRYHKSTIWSHQFFDAIENGDGSITAVGYGKSDISARATNGDLWVLNVDSNGCEGPGSCGPALAVDNPAIRVPENSFRIYPNPTSGSVTIESKGGEAVVYSLTGTKLWQQRVGSGATSMQLPRSLATDIYLVRFTATDGTVSQTRLTYQP